MGLEVIFFFGSNILVCARSTYSSVCQMLCWCMTEKSHLLVGGWGGSGGREAVGEEGAS